MTQGFVYGTQSNNIAYRLAQGRLTLTSGTPVTTTDVTAATTLYFTPYTGNQISLYTGSVWKTITFTEVSISVPASTSQMYDVWGYLSAGALVLELTAWTNDTTRATALSTQDGIYIKSGDATRRYLGSFRTTTVSGQTEDSLTKRYVWNYYNRVLRPLLRNETAVNWTYSTNSMRQVNANTANQLDIVIGVIEDQFFIECKYENYSTVNTQTRGGIGIDSTTTNSANISDTIGTVTTSELSNGTGQLVTFPTTVGRHYYPWLENGGGSGTQTWLGLNNSGIYGWIKG